jgi:creatinine amidohydrolase
MQEPEFKAPALADLTSADVRSAVEGATIVWGVGSIEQHGPHLPLSVDLDIADAMSRATALRLGRAYVAPAQAFGARSLPQSGGGLIYPGTVFLGGAVLIEYLEQVVSGFADLGCSRLVVVNGHYENEAFIFEAVDSCRHAGRLGRMAISAFSWWSLVQQDWIERRIGSRFPGWHAEHAGLTETSLMMYLRPGVVRSMRPEHATPPPAGLYAHPVDLQAIATDGVLSSTTGSTRELGAALFAHVIDEICIRVRSDSQHRA